MSYGLFDTRGRTSSLRPSVSFGDSYSTSSSSIRSYKQPPTNSLSGKKELTPTEIAEKNISVYASKYLLANNKYYYYQAPTVGVKSSSSLRVAVFTWNSDNINFCPLTSKRGYFSKCIYADVALILMKKMKEIQADVFVICLQEDLSKNDDFVQSLLTEANNSDYLGKAGKEMMSLSGLTRQGNRLLVFYKKEFEGTVEVKARSKPMWCGWRGDYSPLASKGAIFVTMLFTAKLVTLTFVSAQLPAKRGAKDKCLQSIQEEIARLQEADTVNEGWSSVAFLAGDLGYRVEYENIADSNSKKRSTPSLDKIGEYLEKDELRKLLREKRDWELSEAEINFMPTCKMLKEKPNYEESIDSFEGKIFRDYDKAGGEKEGSEETRGSWCDRILYRAKGKMTVTPKLYDDMDYGRAAGLSSHKPVVGVYDLK